MNQRVVLVGAVKFAWILSVEEWKPSEQLTLDRLAVLPGALLSAEARLALRTQIDVASFVTRAFADAERAAVNWRRVVALSRLHGDASAARSRARAPIRPVAPASINGRRQLFNVDTFLILTPLRTDKFNSRIIDAVGNVSLPCVERSECLERLGATMLCTFR